MSSALKIDSFAATLKKHLSTSPNRSQCPVDGHLDLGPHPRYTRALLDTCSLHPLETLPVGLVDLRNLVPVLLEFASKLGVVELAVTSAGLDDLGLFLQGEVLPREARPDNVAEQCEDLVVGDGARVGEIVDACVAVLGQKDGCG
jgi:hypothetical protein